jgi:hypothetical protein
MLKIPEVGILQPSDNFSHAVSTNALLIFANWIEVPVLLLASSSGVPIYLKARRHR